MNQAQFRPLLRETAEEARVLFDCMCALAGDALAAAERGDEVTLRRVLDERDRVAERLSPLVRDLGLARVAAGGPRLAEAEVAGVVAAALAVQEADVRLTERLAEIRAGGGRGLDRMDPAAGPHRLDLLR
ncbi:MAG TPA: hypothetical protein VK399_20115 [Longimicrobiaceae bacterium]|nr:hypothetical protein [Longimicrobiaceae bacterium]